MTPPTPPRRTPLRVPGGFTVAAGVSAAIGAVLAAGACSNTPVSPFGYACTGPTSFQVFQAGEAVSAIPFCDESLDGGPQLGYGSDSRAPFELDGSVGYGFPGVPDEPAAALAQCAAICVGATYTFPCCRSQWLPQTIACYPACP
jgi:hypothetical protein